jgi:metacaspase-1
MMAAPLQQQEETAMATTAKKTAATPPRALSLHLGLNTVSAAHYEGWEGPLAACEFDARDMQALAKKQGFTPTLLLTKKATRAAVLKALRAAAKALKAGDVFMLTFSGHGGQVPDTNRDEPDRKDETWCLYDGQLIDDELYFELSRFGRGVRVLVLSDSCHSGSVTRARVPPPPPPGQRPRLMPDGVAQRVYGAHQAQIDGWQAAVFKAAAAARSDDPDAALAQVAVAGPAAQALTLTGPFRPAVLLISGCQDNQYSMDGEHNGAFTEQLLRVWNHGRFAGSHAQLHAQVRAAMPASQSPNLFVLGPPADAAALAAQRAFKV